MCTCVRAYSLIRMCVHVCAYVYVYTQSYISHPVNLLMHPYAQTHTNLICLVLLLVGNLCWPHAGNTNRICLILLLYVGNLLWPHFPQLFENFSMSHIHFCELFFCFFLLIVSYWIFGCDKNQRQRVVDAECTLSPMLYFLEFTLYLLDLRAYSIDANAGTSCNWTQARVFSFAGS